MSTYSFGKDSPLKIELSDELAEAYNNFTKDFFAYQKEFMEENGRPWGPEDPVLIHPEYMEGYNEVAGVLNELIQSEEKAGRTYSEEDIQDDLLVKN